MNSRLQYAVACRRTADIIRAEIASAEQAEIKPVQRHDSGGPLCSEDLEIAHYQSSKSSGSVKGEPLVAKKVSIVSISSAQSKATESGPNRKSQYVTPNSLPIAAKERDGQELGPIAAQYKLVLTPKNNRAGAAAAPAEWLINIHSPQSASRKNARPSSSSHKKNRRWF